MRILSMLTVNSFIYGGFTVLRAAVFMDDGGLTSIVLHLAIICLAYGLGVIFSNKNDLSQDGFVQTKFFKFLAFMLNIRDSKAFISSLIMWGLIILPITAGVVIYRGSGLGRIIFETIAAIFIYILSLKNSRMAHTRFMGPTSIYSGMIIMVLSLELPYLLSRLEYLRPLLFGLSYFMIFSFIVVKNQQDIDKHIFNKKHIDKSVLPKNLRRFNMVFASLIFLIMMLLFNLKTVIVYLIDIVGLIINYVFILFGWLLDKLLVENQYGGEAMENSMSSITAQQRPMPFLNLIVNVAIYFAILYVLYRLLKAVIVRTPSFISKIISFLKKVLNIDISSDANVVADFIDTTEIVLPDAGNVVKRAKKKRTRVKKLNQITNPVEKVRRMYSNILGLLPLSGVKIDKADTANEILAKAARVLEVEEDLSPFTEIYEQVRYGEVVPDGNTLARAEGYYEKAKGGNRRGTFQ